MKSRRRLWLTLAGVVGLLGFGLAYLSRPEPDFAFLSRFRHTLRVDEDGATSTFRIWGDPSVIRSSIPGASAGEVEASLQGTTCTFFLPSGKGATLIWKPAKPDAPCLLLVEGKPAPWQDRLLHRLGL